MFFIISETIGLIAKKREKKKLIQWAHTIFVGVFVLDINMFFFHLLSTCKHVLKKVLKCGLKTSCDLRRGPCNNP